MSSLGKSTRCGRRQSDGIVPAQLWTYDSRMDDNALESGRCSRCVAVALLCLLSCYLPGCKKTDAAVSPPPPAVTVARPIQREVIEWDEYTGRLEAVETVEVRARVSGFIEKADFQE